MNRMNYNLPEPWVSWRYWKDHYILRAHYSMLQCVINMNIYLPRDVRMYLLKHLYIVTNEEIFKSRICQLEDVP